ncbi:hypothetical protein Tco_1281178, partial [Tanacetum coccineum]
HILIELLNHLFFWSPVKYLKFLMEVSDRIDAKGDEPMETTINGKSNEVFGVEWKSKINAKWYKKMTQPPPPPQNQNLNPSNIQKP